MDTKKKPGAWREKLSKASAPAQKPTTQTQPPQPAAKPAAKKPAPKAAATGVNDELRRTREQRKGAKPNDTKKPVGGQGAGFDILRPSTWHRSLF